MADRFWYFAIHRLVWKFGQSRFKKYPWQAPDLKRIFYPWHGRLAFTGLPDIRFMVSFWIKAFRAVQPFPPHQLDRHLDLFSPALQTLLCP